MKIKQQTITPDKAREILKGNTSNRNVRQGHVDYLASEIVNNRFLLTSETIKIANDGTLLDGQHRLLACIQSNHPIDVMVETDADKRIRDVIDTGARRSVADQLHMQDGLEEANLRCAVARSIVSFCCYNQNVKLSTAATRSVLSRFGNEITAAIKAVNTFKPGKKGWAVAVLAFAMKADSRCVDFVEKFGSGEGLKKGDPAKTARDWLLNGTGGSVGRTTKTPSIEGLFNAAFNAAHGNEISTIKRGTNGLDFFLGKERKFVSEIRAEMRQQLVG